MKSVLNAFLLMVQVLTRIPVHKSLSFNEKSLRTGANFFTLIGLMIGMCQIGLLLASAKILPPAFSAILLSLFEIMVTGAYHLDGFADTCDGFFAVKGDSGKEKILEIMRDSRIGTFAAIAIGVDLLIRYRGILYLTEASSFLSLVLLPMSGRFAIVLLCMIGRPAKATGSGNLFINTVTLREAVVNGIFFLAAGALMGLIFEAMLLMGVSFLTVFLFNSWCEKKIGGVTGDSLGAVNELATLLSLVALATLHFQR